MDQLVQRVAHRFEKHAADEIEPELLPPDRQALARKLGLKIETAWDGIHGYILDLDGRKTRMGRIPRPILEVLASDRNVRWVTAHSDSLSVGC